MKKGMVIDMKNRFSKVVSLVLVLALSCCTFAGCGNTKKGGSKGGTAKVLLTLSIGDTFRNALVEQAQMVAEEHGVELVCYDEQNSVESQVAHIEEAAKGGYDAIMCNPVDTDLTLQLELAAGDLPIVFFNSCPDEKYLKADHYVYVGSNEEDAGRFQAEYILEKSAGKSELNLVVFKGARNHSATNGRTDALKQVLRKEGKKVNYVFEDYADWDQVKSATYFKQFLRTNQPYDFVACNNDSMALGVIDVVKELNLDTSTFDILGVDATADGCAAIESDAMAFTVCQSSTGQGEYALLTALELANGGSVSNIKYADKDSNMYVWVPFEKVDKSNVADYK